MPRERDPVSSRALVLRPRGWFLVDRRNGTRRAPSPRKGVGSIVRVGHLNWGHYLPQRVVHHLATSCRTVARFRAQQSGDAIPLPDLGAIRTKAELCQPSFNPILKEFPPV